jgi:Ring finger domain
MFACLTKSLKNAFIAMILLTVLLTAMTFIQRIVSCDDKSTLILGDLDGSVSDDVHSIHSTDPYASTCSICLEAFQISDTVTWSRADVCRHVFHTDCIHEWFSNPKHEDCPSCRAQIIDLDQPDETSDRDNNDAGILYMVMDGLVSTVSNQASWITGEGDFTEPSRLQIAFRRVSSDIYSHLSQNFDLDDDDESVEGLAEPVPFRRTMSEGLRPRALSDGLCPSVNSRGSSSGMHALSRSLSTSSASASTIQDEESQHSEALQCRQALRRTLSDGGPSPDRRRDEVSRPGLFATRAFRRSPSAGLYAKVSGTFDEDDDVDELGGVGNSWGGNDEDSLRLQEGPTLESNDEEDLESGQRLC